MKRVVLVIGILTIFVVSFGGMVLASEESQPSAQYVDFKDYSQMRAWFETKALPETSQYFGNERVRQIQLLGLKDGYLLSISPMTSREYYDRAQGVFITRIENVTVAGGTIYRIYLLDNEYPVYWAVGKP